MLRWSASFLVIAIIAAIFGFGGIAAGAASIAKVLFFLFLVLFVLSLLFGGRFSETGVTVLRSMASPPSDHTETTTKPLRP